MSTRYEGLLEQARANPVDADYTALRMEFTSTPQYKPYDKDDALLDTLTNAVSVSDWGKILEASNALLAENYLDIKAHQWARAAYEHLDQPQFMSFHLHFSQGLLNSIRDSGDGLTPETAFHVIETASRIDYTL